MGRRTLIAFFLSLLVIIGYNYLMAKKYPPPVRETVLEQRREELSSPMFGQAEHSLRGGERNGTVSLAVQPAERGVSLTRPVKQAKEIVVETDLVKLVITSSGARIKSYQLKGYPEENIDPRTVQRQIDQIDQAFSSASAKKGEFLQHEKDKLVCLLKRMEQQPEMAELVSLAATIDADYSPTIMFPDDKNVSFTLNTALYQCPYETLTLSEYRPEGQLEFTYTDAQGREIKKVYSFFNSNYSLGLDISFWGWQEQDLPLGHFLLSYGSDIGLPQAQRGRRTYGYQGPVTYFLSSQHAPSDRESYLTGKGWVKKEKYTRKEASIFVQREHLGRIGWTGLENKYFLAALIPRQPAQSVVVEKNRFGEQKVAVKVAWKGAGTYRFQLYLGPKKEKRLKEIGASLEKTIDYGFFGPIARATYQILVFFSRWTNNFGWAIVLLCLLTKIVFYPLTHRSFESMQKMQQQMKSLQPEMDDLRQKFKDNSQKLNKEIMALYRKRGVNPMASCQSGCLPLLLQMPVFFALYAVLYNSIELRGTPFLGWVKDLSARDPYYILPILMGISMFVQQKLTGVGAASGAQQDQAKMMNLLMPVFLTWIFASLPSGVVLYWLTFNILTALQQLLIRKKQALAVVA